MMLDNVSRGIKSRMTDVILLLILLHPLFVQICMIGWPDTQNTPDQECKFDEQQRVWSKVSEGSCLRQANVPEFVVFLAI